MVGMGWDQRQNTKLGKIELVYHRSFKRVPLCPYLHLASGWHRILCHCPKLLPRMLLHHAPDTWIGGIGFSVLPSLLTYISTHKYWFQAMYINRGITGPRTARSNIIVQIQIQIQSLVMKGLFCQANPHHLCLSLGSFSRSHSNYCPVVPSQSLRHGKMKMMSQAWSLVRRRKGDGLAVGCASWGLEAELERELEAEMSEGEEEERIGMARLKHKCGEDKGLVELLECLEREAIMGEDVGKEPVDYNRRAQIFDRSSRVFQALRQHSTHVSSQQSSQ